MLLLNVITLQSLAKLKQLKYKFNNVSISTFDSATQEALFTNKLWDSLISFIKDDLLVYQWNIWLWLINILIIFNPCPWTLSLKMLLSVILQPHWLYGY